MHVLVRDLLLVWVVRPIVGVILGQAFLQTLHLLDAYPDRRIAQWVAGVIQHPPEAILFWTQLLLTIAIGVSILFAYEVIARRFRLQLASASKVSTPQAGEEPQKRVAEEEVAAPPKPKLPKTLGELFRSDFNLMKNHSEISATIGNSLIPHIGVQAYYDFLANVVFVGFYVPRVKETYSICEALSDRAQEAIDLLSQGLGIEMRQPGHLTGITAKELTFSGAVYIYHELEMDLQQKAALDTLYKSKKLKLHLRGPNYATTKWLQERGEK